MSRYTNNLRKKGLPVLYYVYEIVDSNGAVIDAGFTTDPKSRFRDHIKRPPGTGWGNGRHYGRTDVRMRIARVAETKERARELEDDVKISHGLPTPERDLQKIGGRAIVENGQHAITSSKGGIGAANVVRTCPKCERQIRGNSYFQHVKKCACNLKSSNNIGKTY